MKTILLIEDDPALLRLGQRVLGDAGFAVDSVSDGEQARAKLKTVPYAGIVMDVTVPGSDGYALAGQIGDANRYASLIIIGPDEPGARKQAFDAGALAFLPKPFTTEGLRSVVNSVVSPAGPRAPSAPRAAPRRAPPAVSPAPSETWPAPSESVPAPWEASPAPSEEVSVPPSEATGGEGSIAVRFQNGPVYWCEPAPEGGWRCGRCEMGIIPFAEAGSTCRTCQAEVVSLEARSRGGLGWLIIFVLLAALVVWAIFTWW